MDNELRKWQAEQEAYERTFQAQEKNADRIFTLIVVLVSFVIGWLAKWLSGG